MAFALVQQANDFSFSTGPVTLTLPGPVTKGDLIVCTLFGTGAFNPIAKVGVQDAVNLWIPLNFVDNGNDGSHGHQYAFYGVARRSGNLSITFGNYPNGSTNLAWQVPSAQIMEFSGNSTNPLDDTTEGTMAGPTLTLAVNATGTNELVLGIPLFANGTTVSPNAGWTNIVAGGFSSAYGVQVAAGSYSPSFTQSSAAIGGVIAASFFPSTVASFTIAGSLGAVGAGAQVLFQSTTTAFVYESTADGSGNYISPSMPPDTYLIYPQLVGQYWSQSTATITTADISGKNFTATAINANIVLTQLVADTFIRANENPLNPTNWCVDGTPVPPFDPALAIVSDKAVIGNTTIFSNLAGPMAADGISFFFGAGWNSALANIYSQVAVEALNSSNVNYAIATLGIRGSGTPGSSFTDQMSNMSVINNGDGTCNIFAYDTIPTSGDIGAPPANGNLVWQPDGGIPWGLGAYNSLASPAWIVLQNIPFTLGDTFAIAAVGSDFFILHNGTVIGNWITTTSFSAPYYPMLMAAGQNQTDVEFSNFSAGSVAQVVSSGEQIGGFLVGP